MKSKDEINEYHRQRKERLTRFIDQLPKITVLFLKDIGPFRKGQTEEVTETSGNMYIERGYAKKI